MYLITAMKEWTTDVLPGILINKTYEHALQALKDQFSDLHLAAAYCC
jgi:hypothetical protein